MAVEGADQMNGRPNEPTVSNAAPEQAGRAAATLTLAFMSDPMARWSLRDPERYLAYFPQIVRAFGGAAYEHGSAHQADDFAGVALWLPPGVSADEEALGSLFEECVPENLKGDVYAVLEQMERFHPQEPHWYLPLIGVDPTRQGRGHGAALLRHALARCDADGLPAYLEASNPAGVGFYERHGFETVDVIQIGSSPPLRPMLRRPLAGPL